MQNETVNTTSKHSSMTALPSSFARADDALAVYRNLAEFPTVSSAHWTFQDGHHHAITLNLSTRDHCLKTKLTLRSQGSFQTSEGGKQAQNVSFSAPVSTPTKDDTVIATIHAHRGPHYVILRESSNLQKKDGKARVVELWRGFDCIERHDVTNKHGSFASDDTFGSLSLNEDSTAVLYSAEAISEKNDQGDRIDDLEAFEFVPPLGEKFGKRLKPGVFLLRFAGRSLKSTEVVQVRPPSEAIFQDFLLGQAVFSPDGRSIFTTAYDTTADGKRLGLIYCTNRPSAIYHIANIPQGRTDGEINVDETSPAQAWSCESKDFVLLSDCTRSSRSPRVTYVDDKRNHAALVWLSNEAGGAHNDCAELCGALLTSHGTSVRTGVLCPIVPQPDERSAFPGLYVDQLPQRPWLRTSEGLKLAITSIWGSRKVGILISLALSSNSSQLIQTGISCIHGATEVNDDVASTSILATSPGSAPACVLAIRSTPATPQQLLLGKYASNNSFSWATLWQSGGGHDTKVMTKIVSIKRPHSILMQAVVSWPPREVQKISKQLPCIVFPHGGPHGTSTTEWSPATAALCLQGYIIVQPNYTGSLGRGQTFAHGLIGHVGRLDVDDCMASLDQLVAEGHVDQSRVFVQGGSHGGFLAAHLVGQFPDRFKAASMRNPVIDAGEMVATTDIRDWCFAEFGHSYSFSSPPHQVLPSVYAHLHERSPLAYSHHITAPVLLLVGLSDKRVPPSQARLLYHALRNRGHEVRMLDFEDADHALDTVTAEETGWKATLLWFEKAL